jgi:hypothetical protein
MILFLWLIRRSLPCHLVFFTARSNFTAKDLLLGDDHCQVESRLSPLTNSTGMRFFAWYTTSTRSIMPLALVDTCVANVFSVVLAESVTQLIDDGWNSSAAAPTMSSVLTDQFGTPASAADVAFTGALLLIS